MADDDVGTRIVPDAVRAEARPPLMAPRALVAARPPARPRIARRRSPEQR